MYDCNIPIPTVHDTTVDEDAPSGKVENGSVLYLMKVLYLSVLENRRSRFFICANKTDVIICTVLFLVFLIKIYFDIASFFIVICTLV